MGRFRRLAIASAGAFLVASLTTAAGAAAGLVGQASGAYQLRDVNAFANFILSPPPNFTNETLNVEQGTYVFTPSGGSTTTTHATVLGVQLTSSASGGSGCFVIPDGSLTTNSTTHTFTLHAVITVDEQVATSPLPLESDLNGIPVPFGAPFGPCFPAFGTLPLPMTVDATWGSNGAPMTNRSAAGEFRCGSFSEHYTLANTFFPGLATSTMAPGLRTTAATAATEHLTAQVRGPGQFSHFCQGPVF